VESASFGALLDRYIEQELSERYSTRKSHLSNIRAHIRPRWGEYSTDKMKPMVMEQWLHDLPLAPKSKTHVRGIMHLVFKCAERWGIVELGKNPVSLVRVKNASKRLTANHIARWFWSHNAWAFGSARFWVCSGAISILKIAPCWSSAA
jgi:hypothetical protein